ncbi:MAG: hypothetical protein Ct9H90mP22_7610 [Gammaproteobacteria bacterium]|nr:MAG: hypothetical protein Ct9H90mP22_7610 [Gammaproteobacteria bacterium]
MINTAIEQKNRSVGLEDILFTLQNKREKQEESITIVNSRIEKHHGENRILMGYKQSNTSDK